MCVKFHDEENRLEIIGGASCLYEEIQKCSIPKMQISKVKQNHLHIQY